ncbi:YraN family protein [Sulfurimonas sp. HSL1-2]|uniref:YraN family protein n=1 Tax=Thiomicrolovo zhangzhouensis TaxID=3131933 RepID=UPI0031F84ADC
MSRAVGDAAEQLAVEFLRARGFTVIDRNVSSRFGEIDILAMKEGVLHIVEVKSAPTFEQAANNITPAKIRKILMTAEAYMKKHRLELDYVLDAVIVSGNACELLENITL